MRQLLNKNVPQGGSYLYIILCAKELFNSICAGKSDGKGFSDSKSESMTLNNSPSQGV